MASEKGEVDGLEQIAEEQEHEDEDDLLERDGTLTVWDRDPGKEKFRKRRDRRILKEQRKTLRIRKLTVAQGMLEKVNERRQKKEQEKYIVERRNIFEKQERQTNKGRQVRGTINTESPAVQGYTCQPVSSRWDAKTTSPIFFGYYPKLVAEETWVKVDLKLFGMTRKQWFEENLEAVFIEAVRAELNSFNLPKTCFRVIQVQSVGGENLRRVSEKVESRAKSSKTFARHLANLQGNGAVNIKFSILASCTVDSVAKLDHYVCRSKDLDSHLPPNHKLQLDIPSREQVKADQICTKIISSVNSETLAKTFGVENTSFTFNFLPRQISENRSEEALLKQDTPRRRKFNARKLNFEVADVVDDREQNTSLSTEAAMPRYELAKYVHPSHFGRKMVHCRPNVRKVNPIFASLTMEPLIPDTKTLNIFESHPAFKLDRDFPTPDHLLHPDTNANQIVDSPVTQISPMFFGRVECPLDRNELKHKYDTRHIDKTEQEEAEEDEKFLRNLRMKQSTRLKMNEAELRQQKKEQAIARTIKRNKHPAAIGYKVRNTPVFGNATKSIHPACLGYEVGPDQLLPPRGVQEVIHPACVGYQMVTQELQTVPLATHAINPIFFGLTLEKGPRFVQPQDPDAIRDQMKLKTDLLLKPRRNNEDICHICFDVDGEPCPRCWKPEEWQMKSNFETDAHDVLKALKNNPNIFQRGGAAAVTPPPPRTTMKLKLQMKVQSVFENQNDLTSIGSIERYRSTKATLLTIYVKALPLGNVVKLALESHRTIRDLYFEYRSNVTKDIANQASMWLVISTMHGLICLEDSLAAEDDLNAAYEPGYLKLEDFGLHHKNGEVVMFQVQDLHFPDVRNVAQGFVAQNVNLLRKLDVAKLEKIDLAMRRRLKRFAGAQGMNSGAIKNRINAIRRKVAQERFARQGKSNNNKQQGGDSSEVKKDVKDNDVDLDQNKVILSSIKFDLRYRPNEIERRDEIMDDQLQMVLVREMKDLLKRQKIAWANEVRQREEFIEKTRKEMLKLAVEESKLARAKETAMRKQEEDDDEDKKKRKKAYKPKSLTRRALSIPRLTLGGNRKSRFAVPPLKLTMNNNSYDEKEY